MTVRLAVAGLTALLMVCQAGCGSDSSATLREAVRQGDAQTVKQELAQGGDANAPIEDGGTLLHLAALTGNAEVVALLLEHGAAINAQDEEGLTPLHHAAVLGSTEVAELLLKNGADVNAQNQDGDTPLQHAAVLARMVSNEGHAEVAALLKRYGAQGSAEVDIR